MYRLFTVDVRYPNNPSCVQKELLCKQIGLSSDVSTESFEEAVFNQIGRDEFRMQTLKWYVLKLNHIHTDTSLSGFGYGSCNLNRHVCPF